MKTKDKIIFNALNLFSIKGFDAVSVRDISSAVGIKASSLYNHFQNKQDIFNTIVSIGSERVNNFISELRVPSNIAKITETSENKLCDYEFFNIQIGIFKFYLEDEFIVKFRKMITIEKFNNSNIDALYKSIFIDKIMDCGIDIFSILINRKLIKEINPKILSLQFYAPIFLLFSKYETITDDGFELLKEHILLFRNTYILKG